MALQKDKAESKAKNPLKADISPKGAEKSESKTKDSAKTGPEAKTTGKVVSGPKGTELETNGTGLAPVAAPMAGVTNRSLQVSNPTNSGNATPREDKLTGPPSGGYGIYIVLGLLVGLFGFLWYRGHLQSFRKYVMETRDQLRKCTWPTRDELYQHTVVVFLSTLMMGMFTVLADQAAALLVWDLLLQVPTSVFGKLFGGGV